MDIDSEIIGKKFEDNIENVASVVHDIWAHWQAYLHSQCEELPDGALKIPKELVEQWNKLYLRCDHKVKRPYTYC